MVKPGYIHNSYNFLTVKSSSLIRKTMNYLILLPCLQKIKMEVNQE